MNQRAGFARLRNGFFWSKYLKSLKNLEDSSEMGINQTEKLKPDLKSAWNSKSTLGCPTQSIDHEHYLMHSSYVTLSLVLCYRKLAWICDLSILVSFEYFCQRWQGPDVITKLPIALFFGNVSTSGLLVSNNCTRTFFKNHFATHRRELVHWQ